MPVDQPLSEDGYDIIGDVHGHASLLTSLLAKAGYDEADGTWRHRWRQAVFVGDLIDRGPQQVRTVTIVRQMVEAGSALIVAGNHEFNAVAYSTPDPLNLGDYLRPHNDKNIGQHRAFMDQVGLGSETHVDMIGWFMDMPLWLDLGALRIVHACWDERAMRTIAPLVGPNNSLTPELVEAASRHGSVEWQAIEHLLKGPEVAVDPTYFDKGGTVRDRARLRWWDPAADTLRAAAHIPKGTTTADGEPYPDLPAIKVEAAVAPYRSEIPLFYGHYWKEGMPAASGEHTACVDYSAGTGGPLVAYRWSGESIIDDSNFISAHPI